MLWIKALHIFFVICWMAGVFYLPRIFVNLAMDTNTATTERLTLMARKLYRFSMWLSVFAVVFGAILVYMQYGAKMPGWMHAKLLLVVLVVGYHHACGSILKKFEKGVNTRSHKWFRVFNEVPVFMLLAIVILVVVKPF
ncbi:putative membrane protein [Duganella sp. CF517]|uniref:CopD family protein n=1 Tax=Duganella sp. CF517 TaxID=1881038 RepID=UPI0008CE5DF1|nr:CopD family protein [Duganella sp. CF517]SEO38468.1 putative membrane protein [Duganella sp. CF517]